MNCSEVKKLIPLHAGGDLPRTQRQKVENHIAACSSCALLADEISQGSTWMKSAGLPDFDEADFERMRLAVRSQISRTEGTSGFIESLRDLFIPRMIPVLVAAGIALAAAIGMLVFRYSGETRGPAIAAHDEPPLAPPAALITAVENRPKTSSRRVKPLRSAPRPDSLIVAKQPEESSPRTFETPAPVAAPEVTRIEFQTSDPNIRIVWFTPKKSSPTDSDKE